MNAPAQARLFSTPLAPPRYRGILAELVLAYETYGELNAAKDNAVLVIHGFSADSHVASHGAGDQPGWWEWAVGPGKPLDTDRYFLVCANNFGSCFGSSGPLTPDRATGAPLAAAFPPPSVAELVWCQRQLQDALGISRWHSVLGGSLGGMAVLEWVASEPAQLGLAVCINAGARLSATGRSLMGIQAELIRTAAQDGLRQARQLATLTYLAEEYFCQREAMEPGWRTEDWLAAEAAEYAARFDLYSYLGILQAIRSFDRQRPERAAPGPRLVVAGCCRDILFPETVLAETAARFGGGDVHLTILDSLYGHDAFLLDEAAYTPLLRELYR